MRSWLGLLLVPAVVLIACASKEGKAGPLGPQPQARQEQWPFTETWRTPYPTPFGTAGMTGIPPRPSHRPALSWRELWRSIDDAHAAIVAFDPVLPPGTQVFPDRFVAAVGEHGCPSVARAAAVQDIEASYAGMRHALLEAGFKIGSEAPSAHDGPFTERVLVATTDEVRASVGAGSYDPAFWSTTYPTTHPYLMRVFFTQLCGRGPSGS